MGKVRRILEIIALTIIIGTIVALPVYLVYLLVNTGVKIEKMKKQQIELEKNIETIEQIIENRKGE